MVSFVLGTANACSVAILLEFWDTEKEIISAMLNILT
jgi:hypothetical protein